MPPDNQRHDPFSKLTKIEEKYKGFINLLLKPIITALILLSIGYYTMWMSMNYVKQDKFVDYIEQQLEMDKKQDEVLKTRFELTQTKLETIIAQQITFTEQFKNLNLQISSTQKYLDNINERMTYLERHYFSKVANKEN
jgi:predicted nuclease with TOPRIM domain